MPLFGFHSTVSLQQWVGIHLLIVNCFCMLFELILRNFLAIFWCIVNNFHAPLNPNWIYENLKELLFEIKFPKKNWELKLSLWFQGYISPAWKWSRKKIPSILFTYQRKLKRTKWYTQWWTSEFIVFIDKRI